MENAKCKTQNKESPAGMGSGVFTTDGGMDTDGEVLNRKEERADG